MVFVDNNLENELFYVFLRFKNSNFYPFLWVKVCLTHIVQKCPQQKILEKLGLS